MLASSHFPVIGPGVVFIIVALPVLVMGLAAHFSARGEERRRTAVARCPVCGDPQGEGACEAGPCEPFPELGAVVRWLGERSDAR